VRCDSAYTRKVDGKKWGSEKPKKKRVKREGLRKEGTGGYEEEKR
jgi:hypothetical protein